MNHVLDGGQDQMNPFTAAGGDESELLRTLFLKSSLPQSRPNKAGLKCPSVRPYIRTTIHKMFL